MARKIKFALEMKDGAKVLAEEEGTVSGTQETSGELRTDHPRPWTARWRTSAGQSTA